MKVADLLNAAADIIYSTNFHVGSQMALNAQGESVYAGDSDAVSFNITGALVKVLMNFTKARPNWFEKCDAALTPVLGKDLNSWQLDEALQQGGTLTKESVVASLRDAALSAEGQVDLEGA